MPGALLLRLLAGRGPSSGSAPTLGRHGVSLRLRAVPGGRHRDSERVPSGSERTEVPIPPDNVDLSDAIQLPGQPYHREFWTVPYWREYLDAFLTAIAARAHVRTNRLHVAIAAGMLGKTVELFDNDDYKIRAVHEYSLAGRCPTVTYVPAVRPARDGRGSGLSGQRPAPARHASSAGGLGRDGDVPVRRRPSVAPLSRHSVLAHVSALDRCARAAGSRVVDGLPPVPARSVAVPGAVRGALARAARPGGARVLAAAGVVLSRHARGVPHGRDAGPVIELVDDGPLLAPFAPMADTGWCATSFSGGKDSLLQVGLLTELTGRPLVVTTTSPLPGLFDHETPRRRHVLSEVGRRRRLTFARLRRTSAPRGRTTIRGSSAIRSSVNETTDTFLYFAALLVVSMALGATHLFLASEAELQESVAARWAGRPASDTSCTRRPPSGRSRPGWRRAA